jgi:hypothetical protein
MTGNNVSLSSSPPARFLSGGRALFVSPGGETKCLLPGLAVTPFPAPLSPQSEGARDSADVERSAARRDGASERRRGVAWQWSGAFLIARPRASETALAKPLGEEFYEVQNHPYCGSRDHDGQRYAIDDRAKSIAALIIVVHFRAPKNHWCHEVQREERLVHYCRECHGQVLVHYPVAVNGNRGRDGEKDIRCGSEEPVCLYLLDVDSSGMTKTPDIHQPLTLSALDNH